MKHYKLTNQDNTTHGNFKWKIGKWYKTSGNGNLCGPGWLHFYTDPLLAVFFNPIHAGVKNPKLWEAEVKGKTKDDNGIKCGWTIGRIVRQIKLPIITTEQRIEIAIRCGMAAYRTQEWTQWAENWLSGKDRTANAANAAYAAANDAYAASCVANAAYAAACVAYAAANAANAAAYVAAYVANVNILKIIKQVMEATDDSK